MNGFSAYETLPWCYLQADWPFYLALSLFRLCSILAGVGARAAQGNASSRIAGQVGTFILALCWPQLWGTRGSMVRCPVRLD